MVVPEGEILLPQVVQEPVSLEVLLRKQGCYSSLWFSRLNSGHIGKISSSDQCVLIAEERNN